MYFLCISEELSTGMRPCGLMDKAPDFGTGDCRFESCRGQSFCGKMHMFWNPCFPSSWEHDLIPSDRKNSPVIFHLVAKSKACVATYLATYEAPSISDEKLHFQEGGRPAYAFKNICCIATIIARNAFPMCNCGIFNWYETAVLWRHQAPGWGSEDSDSSPVRIDFLWLIVSSNLFELCIKQNCRLQSLPKLFQCGIISSTENVLQPWMWLCYENNNKRGFWNCIACRVWGLGLLIFNNRIKLGEVAIMGDCWRSHCIGSE